MIHKHARDKKSVLKNGVRDHTGVGHGSWAQLPCDLAHGFSTWMLALANMDQPCLTQKKPATTTTSFEKSQRYRLYSLVVWWRPDDQEGMKVWSCAVRSVFCHGGGTDNAQMWH